MRAELSLQFVDSNVLVYAYDAMAGVKHAQARPWRLLPSFGNPSAAA